MESALATQLLVFLAGLQVKHFICDGPLQTAAMVAEKGHYGRGLGLLHALIHGIGTACVVLAMGFSLKVILFLAAADFLLHYHIDFSKEQTVRRMGWTTATPQFWWALSADQSLHQLTYLLLVWIAVTGV